MWYLAIFLVIIWGFVGLYFVDLYRNQKNYSNDIVNYDSARREFCYRVEKNRTEIWKTLEKHDRYTATKYRFNSETGIITFYSELPDGYLDVSYRIEITEKAGYSVLWVVQFDRFYERTKYGWLQNEFCSQKLDAVPIPYEKDNSRQ